MRSLKPASLIRPVVLSLIAGWLVALILGLWIARLQYTEVINAFPPDRVNAEYESRIDREIRRGPLLLFLQVGVVAGVLVWQIGVTARHTDNPRLYGAVAGALVGLIEGGIALAIGSPWAFIVPLIVVLIAAGVYGGWSAFPPAELE
jgi:uncharacterized protein YneF (UPF0154 family)